MKWAFFELKLNISGKVIARNKSIGQIQAACVIILANAGYSTTKPFFKKFPGVISYDDRQQFHIKSNNFHRTWALH